MGDWKSMIKILKERVNENDNRGFLGKALIARITYFLFGFLSTQGTIFGKYNPFGISAVASVPRKHLFPTLMGTIIGYLFMDKLSQSIGYISAILMIMTLKWTLNGLIKIRNHFMFMPVICFVSSLTIGLVTNYSGELESIYVYTAFLESLIASFCTYWFSKTFETLVSTESISGLYDIRYVLLSAFIIISSMYNFTIYGLSVGKILSILIILFSAYCFGVYGGSISGAVTSIVLGISAFGTFNISGPYALAGTVSGLCANGGKIGICISFMICNMMFMFHSYAKSSIIVSTVYEVICAIILFMMIPRESIYYVRKIFKFNMDKGRDRCRDYNDNQGNEKEYISEAIKSISNVTGTVIPGTFPKSRTEIENACISSVYKVCKNCNLKSLCWERDSNLTRDFFNNITSDILKNKNDTDYGCLVGKRCKNIKHIVNVIKINIRNYNSEMEAKKRIKELHNGVSEKFSFAEVLYGYAAEGIKFNDMEDYEKSKTIKILLSKFGIETVRVEYRFSNKGRVFIEIEVMKIENRKLISPRMIDRLSKLCGVKLDEPVKFDIENRTLIRITEKTVFDLDINISRHNCNNGEFCGDCCSCFKDGTGKFSVVISDGMGTGGRAAADGAVTAGIIERLIRLRVEPDSAIKIANLSILGKSIEESLTAVDIMAFDMFSGKTEFIKAGAPLTFICKEGRVEKIETSSLPIGIFNETSLSVNNVNLKEGDLVVMLSDGVTDVGVDWVENKLKNLGDTSLRDISENILREALHRRSSDHDDDITVAAISVIKK